MNFFRHILSNLSATYRSKIIRKENDLLLEAIINALPTEFLDVKSQIKLLVFHGMADWSLIPGYKFIYFSASEETFNKLKNQGINYKITDLEIFSIKTQQFESIELLINNNLISGLKINHSDYTFNEFDHSRINAKKAIKIAFDFPLNETELFYKSLDDSIKALLDPIDFFDIDYNNKTFYIFLDLEDGNYLAIDKKQRVFSLIHDANPVVMKMNLTFIEILTKISEGKFDISEHVNERYKT